MSAHPNSEAGGSLTQFRRGFLAGLSIPLLGLVIVSIPVLLAWVIPGSDSVSASSAVRAAAVALLSGLRGGVVLNGSAATVAPLTVTVLLGWLVCGPARRLESNASVVGLCTGFPVACLALARWLPLGSTYAPQGRTALASTIFAISLASLARCGPTLWYRCGERWKTVLRASGAALAGYTAVAALLVAVSLVAHWHTAVALQTRVAPGVEGLAVLLLGLGAAPNAVLMAAGYLSGAGFSVGTGTQASVLSTRTGPMPDFPLLAAVPGSAGLSIAGVVIAAFTTLLLGWVIVAQLGPLRRGWRNCLDLAAVAAVVAVVVFAAATVARGGIAGSAVTTVGVSGWRLALFSGAAVMVGSVVAGAVRALIARLRPAGVSTARFQQATIDRQAATDQQAAPDQPTVTDPLPNPVRESGSPDPLAKSPMTASDPAADLDADLDAAARILPETG